MTDDTHAPKKRAPRRHSRRKPHGEQHAETRIERPVAQAAAEPAAPAATRAAPDTAHAQAAATMPAAPAGARPLATVPIHVRWHDLDAFNHVNNASFLILLEEARLQWLRTVPGEWFGEHAMPVAASIQLNYRRPISWPADGIDVVLTGERLGSTSITIGNRVVERSDPACVYAEGNLVMVWMDPATGKAVPLPEAIRKACSV